MVWFTFTIKEKRGEFALNEDSQAMYKLNQDGNVALNMKNNGMRLEFIQSYAGMTLDEIASWYPKGVTTEAVLDYLTQERLFDVIENILEYSKDTHFESQEIGPALGLFDFCSYCDWLAHRACFVMYVGTDSWLILDSDEANETRKKKFLKSVTYNRQEYLEYVTELEGGNKRYITRGEFIDFLNKAKKHQNVTSLYNKPYSLDSLFLALFQHGEEFGYTYNDIIDKVLVKTDEPWGHPNEANEFIKYYNFLKSNCGQGSILMSTDQLIYNFFNKVEMAEDYITDLSTKLDEELDEESEK